MYAPISEYACVPSAGDIPIILKEWDIQKSKNLQKLFGGDKLILNRPYTYTVESSGIVQEIEEALQNNNNRDIYYRFKTRVKGLVYTAKDFPTEGFDLITELFDTTTLGFNAYTGKSIKLTFLNGEIWKIPTGMKPMKIISKIIKRYGNSEDKKEFEDFRIWHSMLLNQIHLDGTLSLSIHPLDYMTMSDNDGSWSSCMRWMPDGNDVGDYRMGTVECMNSPYIIVAYLHNPKKQMEIWHDWQDSDNKLTWNKKKWRELFIVQDGIITEIKGYPFQDENLTNTVLMWIKELAHENLGWEYDDIEINVADEYKTDNKVNMFKFHTEGYMYNDFGSLRIHRGRVNLERLQHRVENNDDIYVTEYMPRDALIEHVIYEINYGGKATCMCCGDTIPYYDNRCECVLCPNCEQTQVCPCCGEYFDGDGYYVTSYNDPICSYCFDYECGLDDLSEDREAYSSLLTIKFAIGFDEDSSPIFYKNSITTLNPDDYTNFAYEKLFNRLPLRYKSYNIAWHEGDYYVTLDMVKDMDTFLDVFDINEDELSDIFEHPEDYSM